MQNIGRFNLTFFQSPIKILTILKNELKLNVPLKVL